jgi:transposase
MKEVVVMEVVVERCAALDVHKDTVMACVRRPGNGSRRGHEIREFKTFTSTLRELRDWLAAERVTHVAMEATGVYWCPVWAVLEELDGVELLLANAHHVKNVPGRKTDVADAMWLAQLLECGLLRGSFVPPPVIARLRDLTRYRKKLIEDRAREIQRVQKVLEIAGVKLDSVVSDVMGKGARRMMEALISGERDVEVMAEMALARMRPKIPELQLALESRFDDHHALMLSMHLRHIDHLSETIDRMDVEVERELVPFAEQLQRLCTMPGIGKRTAEVVIAEIGVDMTRFPTAGHLASWAGLCPGHHESAGKQRSGKARKGDAVLRTALCEAAWSAAKARDTYLAAQFRRFSRRFGKRNENKAIFAVAHTMIVSIWWMLSNGVDYEELGGDYFERRTDTEAQTRRLVRQLERLGHNVNLTPAA